MKLDRLPWIDISPYDQVLTDLISSCQKRDVGLICVQGPNGSGKSRILTELLSALSFDATASLIALSGNDNEVFYHNVEVSSNLLHLNDPEFLHHFTLTLESILKEKQHFYILIDDVEALPYELIAGIMNILNDNLAFKEQVTLVVFMGVMPIQLETRRLFVGAEMITLKGMNLTQAKQFIDKVYHYTHQSKQLTMSEVNHLNGLSYGYAGRLIKLLEQYLDQPRQAKAYKPWWIAIIVLFLPLIGVFLWFQYYSNNIDIHKEIVLEPIITEESEPVPVKKEIIPVKVILPIQDDSQVDPTINTIITPISDVFIGPILTENSQPEILNAEPVIQEVPKTDIKPVDIDNNIDKKTVYNYVIELGRHQSKEQLERTLKGRSIPGKAQFTQIEVKGSKIWIAYIGPYGSEEQAQQGKAKLPASLQSLPLKVRKEF